ncbi:zinc-binding dehydrogenase [Arcobacter sp. FWKO B]|uniref:zinc-binding dehydrogenase n=1 Tax=Arcobacter sp. FWKO B TaxID=2593672 RepID=UPI0018A4FC2E|nr:zinc-binding dehydrogenase [Arcobacter sp. FWKO B]QOG12085.1 zinc-binding dehydrogenase [Arcobacter sp. FWKO B]
MKAAVLYELAKPLKVEEIQWSTLLRGQVLVELAYSGVCHSQLMEVRGKRGEDKFLPHLLGHEATGIVKEIGPDVTKVKVGDKVVLGWIKGDGINAEGAKYLNDDKIIVNSGGVTTFNEYSVVSENRLVKLPDDVPLDIGVLFGCAIPTGSGIVTNEIQPEENSTIAIFGLGGIGLSALMATKLYKCSKIIAIDIEDNKLELAKEFGATDTINSLKEDSLKKILDLTDGKGVDYAVEASGITMVIETAFKSVKNNGGLSVFASHPKAGELIKIDPFDLICGKNIKGSWGGGCYPDRDLPKFFDLYLEGKLPLDRLLEKRYTLDEINFALDDLENRKVTRPLIEINKNIG